MYQKECVVENGQDLLNHSPTFGGYLNFSTCFMENVSFEKEKITF